MLTIVIKRDKDPNVNLLTELQMTKYLWQIAEGGEVLLEDTWQQGLKKVNTPYVCLVDADCVLSGNYVSSNYSLMKKTEGKMGQGGGYNKLAMLSSPVGIKEFANRIFNYRLEKTSSTKEIDLEIKTWNIQPNRDKRGMKLYSVQVGFVPGAVIRMSALDSKMIDNPFWDNVNAIKLSTVLSLHFWDTGRRIAINPNTTYVSTRDYLENPPLFDVDITDKVANLFVREGF